MKIEFESSIKYGYVALFPIFAVMWKYDQGIYFGWLFWSVSIKPEKPYISRVEQKPISAMDSSQKVVHKKYIARKCPTEGKTSYMEIVAKREAQRFTKKNHTKMRAYRCMFCDYWHITHKKNKLSLH